MSPRPSTVLSATARLFVRGYGYRSFGFRYAG